MAQDDSARDRDPMARRVARAEEMLEAGLLGKFLERLHPRDRGGKFSHSLGMSERERAHLESKYGMQGKRAAAAGPSKHEQRDSAGRSRAAELKAAHDVEAAHPGTDHLEGHTSKLSPARRAVLKSALDEDEGTHAITTPKTHAAIKSQLAFHDRETAADARAVRPARNPKFDESSKGLIRGSQRVTPEESAAMHRRMMAAPQGPYPSTPEQKRQLDANIMADARREGAKVLAARAKAAGGPHDPKNPEYQQSVMRRVIADEEGDLETLRRRGDDAGLARAQAKIRDLKAELAAHEAKHGRRTQP